MKVGWSFKVGYTSAFSFQPSAAFLILNSEFFILHLLEPRFAQGGNMPLQHCWVFNRHALFVHFQ